MEIVRVKIISFEKPTYWYAKNIGETFECYHRGEMFQVINGNYGSVRYIQKGDCYILDWVNRYVPKHIF